jgi:hypothetical protein
MDYPRRRLILETSSSTADLYGAADRRLLVKIFGARAIEGCEIVCMWNDLAPDHDWIVAVIRDAVGDHFVCEYLASEDHRFCEVELFSSKVLTRVTAVLKNDDTPGVCHEHRLQELDSAAKAANAALGSRIIHHEGKWVRDELTALGRAEVSSHGHLQPGNC